jgi:HK97 family phage major capsid protein
MFRYGRCVTCCKTYQLDKKAVINMGNQNDDGGGAATLSARTGLTMTYSQAINRIAEIESRMTDLSELDALTPEQDSEYRELLNEAFQVDEYRKRLERADDLAKVKSVKGQADNAVRAKNIRIVPGSTQGTSGDYDRDSILEPDSIEDHRFRNPWDLSDLRMYGRDPGDVATELRSRALSAIEKMPVANAKIREAATSIIENFDSKDSRLARQCLVTSKPAYMRAWSKLACNKPHSLTVEEQRALNDVEEFRAMSLTDVQGGYLIPFQLDPTVIVTSTFVRSDLRGAARVVIATGDVWNGVTSQNVSWSFQAEGAEVGDNSPPFGQPSIPNYMARGFIPISIEAMADEQNVAQEVGRLLANGKLDLEGLKFIQGLGIGEPTGLMTALGVSGNATSVITTAAAHVFALADLYSLQGALPAHYRQNATWLANNLVYNMIRQFDQAGGAAFWTNLTTDRPPMLYGRDALEAEAMSSSITTTSPKQQILVYGDLSQYVITDRIGMAVEFIPHLFSKNNNRPTGSRGWFAYYRTGGDLVNPTGVRVLAVQ